MSLISYIHIFHLVKYKSRAQTPPPFLQRWMYCITSTQKEGRSALVMQYIQCCGKGGGVWIRD